MNRICAAFDDIGNINLNFAGVPPFNYQMLLSEPFYDKNTELVQTFCDLDSMSISTEIALSEIPPHERNSTGMYEILADVIKETLTEQFGSMEYCYPILVKALFAGDNWKKASHKKMFWRIFGEIALQNIENNLKDHTVCPDCDAKIPKWAKDHTCPKNTLGFYVCEDCGKQCVRINSRQVRCEECQKAHREESNKLAHTKMRERKKVCEKRCISFLRSRSMATSETEPSGQPMFFVNHGQQAKSDQDG